MITDGYYTVITYYKDGTLEITELLDNTQDGLVINAIVTDESGKFDFKVVIEKDV